MKRFAVVTAALLTMAACSAKDETAPSAPGPRPAKTQAQAKQVDICGLMPASKVSELIGQQVETADGGPNECNYRGADRGAAFYAFTLDVEYVPGSWTPELITAEFKEVPGLGKEAWLGPLFTSRVLKVRLGEKDSLTIEAQQVKDAELEKVAKEVIPKL